MWPIGPKFWRRRYLNQAYAVQINGNVNAWDRPFYVEVCLHIQTKLACVRSDAVVRDLLKLADTTNCLGRVTLAIEWRTLF